MKTINLATVSTPDLNENKKLLAIHPFFIFWSCISNFGARKTNKKLLTRKARFTATKPEFITIEKALSTKGKTNFKTCTFKPISSAIAKTLLRKSAIPAIDSAEFLIKLRRLVAKEELLLVSVIFVISFKFNLRALKLN
jgi:hypothetical protein